MVEIPAKIKETISNYIRALNENNVNVVRAVLFGSYAKGNYSEWSDIDLAVVSNAFEGSWIKDRKKSGRLRFPSAPTFRCCPIGPKILFLRILS